MKAKMNLLLLINSFSLMVSPLFAQDSSIIAEGAELQLVVDGYDFTEGPSADKNGDVFFTDQPNDQILKYDVETNSVSVFMEGAGRANGLYFDNENTLIACADEEFQLVRITSDKDIKVLVEDFEGKDLNGPNDLWIDEKGGIYFTDPYYQRPYWDRSSPDLESQNVYYLAPGAKSLIPVADDLVQPNGIIGTPDGKTLYVADIGDKKTYSYSISEDGSLSNKTLFVEMGSDGMTLDNKGNLYLTGDGVTVFNQKGEQIKHIPVDANWTANVTFGGKNEQTLFITAMDALYSLDMNVEGVRWK
ncbi:SMP-30/gluconolactonase/LRE family protein [Salegentibacter sp. F188]|uniref:SMP-30/gluconolactonase/LRE family protein n=1 Tax=Autumnicola patrickiae TaxID=3075591 RepID=A0ABU3E8N2_9FLAO|nr:SMP-30/gluconolactonase/LRE family protein [Salegentibacter sp. F188]MDT0691602.1 SMP-30/gluconolactonase/LRE family protein [Salegentibacter sp. F188]